ncbi:MAG: ergothioneine biosynthesis protein EgtB [Chloroflexi bacterium]|nr:ergothioneine biosynthesis protein EgtB [Chloroflexota bacterium]
MSTSPSASPATAAKLASSLGDRYKQVRQATEALCTPLVPEDFVIQSMADVSPPKWHLAHTTWFFETFLLSPTAPGYRPFHPLFRYLFNSYYQGVGAFHPRPQRGLLSRPTVDEVYRYRKHVDEAVLALVAKANEEQMSTIAPIITLGLQHEQQHQELLLTDIKHVFASNPLRPVYQPPIAHTPSKPRPSPLRWVEFAGGLSSLGHRGDGFCFDNELQRHQVFLQPFRIASRLVTNEEYLSFMEDGGYHSPRFWLSDGWDTVQRQRWDAPLYWEKSEGHWWQMTLRGMEKIEGSAPVCHVSFYEADAYARWAEKRLPTEAEWEHVAAGLPIEGTFQESQALCPLPAPGKGFGTEQIFGDVWEWTRSAYGPYPGYRPPQGAVGEYNGKFMSGQMVLRGGSCATPISHIRPTYRNFFPPHARWQFMGIRLADDA